MPTLLLEIGCEELPARACYEAEAQLPELVRGHLGVEPSKLYIGPRRLAVLVEDLPERTADEWVKGPPESRREQAAVGFARKHGLGEDELETRDGFLWARVPGEELRGELLLDRLREIVHGLAFSKSMRWDDSGHRFARPVRWACEKLDAETLWGDGTTFGRRFFAGEVEVPSAQAYEETLRAAGVEPDAAERERMIREGLDALGEWSDPAGVLREVIHLVEWPFVLGASFDERYLALPERVIQAPMQADQRYFPLGGNRFAVVANGGEPEIVRAGHENVLESRLEDASFTFERDVKKGIDALAGELGSITFFAGAGTFADKTERLIGLVERLGGGEASREAARLAKADQAAELVREFPDLEGYIGAEYARLAGYPEAVCAAIEEHYLPDAAGAPLPASEGGRILSAADKIDNLDVAFGLGRRPTGSRDPLGLRRDAFGLCRLAVEGGLVIPRELLEEDARDFVEERLEGLLEVPVEFVRAARESSVRDLGAVAELARVLATLDDARLDRLHTVYTRASNIVRKAGEDDLPEVRPELLAEEAERRVAEAQDRAFAGLSEAADFDAAVAAAEQLADPLARFFDEVLVMADDAGVRQNRLRLLHDVRDLIRSHLGDLAQIPR
jgi:glycyl-tRNA synthetase beta chain